jgi:hypothetical protein
MLHKSIVTPIYFKIFQVACNKDYLNSKSAGSLPKRAGGLQAASYK